MALRLRNIVKKILDQIGRRKRKAQLPIEEIYERCVICGELTAVRIDTPIEFRDYYEIGSGQICYSCHKKIEEENQKQYKPEAMQYLLNQCRKH